MKVLKYGKDNPNLKKIEVTCTGKGFADQTPCASLLEITGLDLRVGTQKDYGNFTTKYYYIICSECGTKTEISEKDLTPEMKELAKSDN